MKKNLQMDEADISIIRALLVDSRKSSRQIAETLRLSHQTVLSRMKALEDAGVIKGYTTLVDFEQLGFPIQTVILIELGKRMPKDLEQLKNYAARENAFTCCGQLTGDYDLFVIGHFRSQHEAQEKIAQFRAFLSKQLDLHVFRTYPVWTVLKHCVSPKP